MRIAPFAGALLIASALGTPHAAADEIFGLDLSGSFGEGGFDRYVPPITMPTLNETPFITTEVRPIYLYHNIPSEFITGGGDVNGVAAQARIAFSDRFGFIATTDGWADINFAGVLPNSNGLLDVTAGVKYAVISDPEAGQIVSVGLRYTAPLGNVNIASTGLDLNGSENGSIDAFITGAKVYEEIQLQGSVGVQAALSGESWTYLHAHAHADYELFDGFFPLVEANVIAPIQGGDRLPGAPLTGTDLFDLGAGNPETTVTLGIGARYQILDWAMLGAAVSTNMNAGSGNSLHGTRVYTDMVFHF